MISKHTILAEWFLDTRYPHLPCLHVGETEYLPMEFCRIVKGQKVKDWKINQERKDEIAKVTSEKPRERFSNIEEFVSVFHVLTRTLYRSRHESFTRGQKIAHAKTFSKWHR